jgi:hypothetical protein
MAYDSGFSPASLGVSMGASHGRPRLAVNWASETIVHVCPTRSVSALDRLTRLRPFPSCGRCHVIEREPLTKAALGV